MPPSLCTTIHIWPSFDASSYSNDESVLIPAIYSRFELSLGLEGSREFQEHYIGQFLLIMQAGLLS